MIRRDHIRTFLPALYPVGAFLVLAPLADVLSAAWPFQVSEPAWRFGIIGLEFRSIILQVLGFSVIVGTSSLLGQRSVLRGLSVVAVAAAIVLCAGVVRFVVDYRDLQGLLGQGASPGFDTSAFRAVLAAILAVPVLTTLGGRGFLASRDLEPTGDALGTARAQSIPAPARPKQVIPFPHPRSASPRWRNRS
jgi:hypothetical protein